MPKNEKKYEYREIKCPKCKEYSPSRVKVGFIGELPERICPVCKELAKRRKRDQQTKRFRMNNCLVGEERTGKRCDGLWPPCEFYRNCLDEAIKRGWHGWSAKRKE